MSQITASHCYYCGTPVDPQRDEFCPNCHYPASPANEEAYLTSALASLQQAMSYGGAQLKVVELFQRYQNRLRMLQKPSAVSSSSAPANAPEVAAPASVRVASVVYQMNTPRKAEVAAPPVPTSRSEPRRIFSWRAFFADQAINIVASLGAFLILVGALSFVATTSNLLLAFFIIFVVHAVFGITGIVTHRFASFRIVASIYTVIFALLVPLVGFSAYRLVGGNELTLSIPVLIAVSALYAAIVYIMLALFQRYTPFAYLGIAALAVADLATASALNLAYWWWPSMLIVLALLSLVSIARSPRTDRIFSGNRAILRQPVRIFMYVFVVMGTLGMILLALYSAILDRVMIHSTEVGYAILCLALLRLFWSIGGFWFARRTRGVISLAFLFLVSVLAFCYALQFDAIGYTLAITVVALLYASISRFGVQYLQPFGALDLQLDWIALVLVLLVPFVASPTLPLQLVQAFTPGTVFQANWQTFAEVGAIIAGLILTLSIAFKRAGYEAISRQSAWRWLLPFGTFLFICAYSLAILALHISPLWSFLGASVAFMVGAVLVRQYIDEAWADPLDVSVLFMILVTLGLGLNAGQGMMGGLLLFFFAATYTILLYQRRTGWFFVPTVFALLAIPALFNHLMVLAAPGIAFPLAAVGIRRFFSKEVIASRIQHTTAQWLANQWEWPLLVAGFVYAGIVGIHDINVSTSTIQQSLSIPCPTAIELALFALSWYASAVLACVKGWLLPALVFATGALLLPTNSFWALVILTPALAILAVVARRFAGNAWSAPLTILALLAGIMTGYTGFTQHHLEATTVALLAFAIIAYAIGVIEDTTLPMWITPFFATWSAIVSAWFLSDLFRPPVVATVAAVLGMAASLYGRKHALTGHPRLKLSALPPYVTAFLAALFTAFWPQSNAAQSMTIAYCMLGFTAIALVILLVERIPELLVFPAGFAAATIWLWYPQPGFTSLMIAYTGLCVLVFATQFTWRVFSQRKGWLAATTLHEVLGIGGQVLIVIVILSQNGFFASAGTLAQVGAGALLVLAALIFAYGLLRPYTVALSLPTHIDVSTRLRRIQIAREVQRRCYYMAGFLLSLVVSWELSAFHQTRLDVLLLAPASYLTVIAPFLLRDTVIRERRVIGHTAAVLGSCLLLLPALWFSFNDGNFVPTAILLGESLALLVVGMIARVRIFILSSTGLVIVGTLRALFLATPPALTLMLTGVTLLVIATALILTRRKLQIAWTQWD
jgi:hypothetical protein